MDTTLATPQAGWTPFRVGMAAFCIGVGIELAIILFLNSGHFVFSLDDAYIHLALAENIPQGCYGINLEESSAPSSSILWPFLLAPFTLVRLGVFAAFLLNVVSAVGTLFLFQRILDAIFPADGAHPRRAAAVSVLLVLLIPATNMIGLLFTGMEHSLQVFLSVLIVWGLIRELRDSRSPRWLIAAIIAAPLIRYENLAVSLPALLYLFFRGYRKATIFSAAGVIVLLDAFCLFLAFLGLEPFPSSVIAKSPVVATGGSVRMLLRNLSGTWEHSRGIFLFLGMLALVFHAVARGKRKEEKFFAGSMALAAFLHLLAGRYDWYSRYEIYIWTTTLLSLLYLSRERLASWMTRRSFFPAGVLVVAAMSAISLPYFGVLLTTPLAARNIYEQHYQMHRFAVEYYQKPVAVNDLGYVSYRNPHYVLDLWGLGSLQALNQRLGDQGPAWMNQLAAEHDVHLAMIYDGWFSALPGNWRRIGHLHLGKKKITAARSAVAFYALDSETYEEALELIEVFQHTLPKGVRFQFE